MPTLDPETINRIVIEEATTALLQAAHATQAEIQRLVPVKTGTARRSITTGAVQQSGENLSVAIGSAVQYVRWLNDGTGIYGDRRVKITPRARQALAFISNSYKGEAKPYTLAGRARNTATVRSVEEGLVVRRSVRGIPPMRFIQRGIDAAQTARIKALEAAKPRITERLAEIAKSEGLK